MKEYRQLTPEELEQVRELAQVCDMTEEELLENEREMREEKGDE